MARNNSAPLIALTMGDPAGVGPELIARALDEYLNSESLRLAVVAAPKVLKAAVDLFGSAALGKALEDLEWVGGDSVQPSAGPVTLVEASSMSMNDIARGKASRAAGRAAWDCLEAAMDLVLDGPCEALVTAPVNKAALMSAGFPYPGHTEWLEKKSGGNAVMMLAAKNFRVVPVTMHVPIAKVPRLLKEDLILGAIKTVDQGLRRRMGIKSPRLYVTGLNPHAGEDGVLGKEEKGIIAPAVERARALGVNAQGPFPADSMFGADVRRKYDAAICMYHDQAMLPIKTLGMERTVNVTLGLPIVRTSPGHGTAFDIAWQGAADPRSTLAAIELARHMAKVRRKSNRG